MEHAEANVLRTVGATLLVLATSAAFAADVTNMMMDCSAEQIKAFNSTYSSNVKTLSSENIFQHTCSSNSAGRNINVSVPVDGVPVAIGASETGSKTACATSTKSYFSKFSEEIIYSNMADDVKKTLAIACFSGLKIYATEASKIISVTVAGNSTVAVLPKIKSLVWGGSNGYGEMAAAKADDGFGEGTEIPLTGVTGLFMRNPQETGAITFKIGTVLHGDVFVTVPGMEDVPINWGNVAARRNDVDNFVCVAQLPNGPEQKLNGAYDAAMMGLNGQGSSAWRNAYCELINGRMIRFSPGSNTPTVVVDKWEIDDAKDAQSREWTCKRNEEAVGKVSCPTNATTGSTLKVCDSEEGKLSICVSRFSSVPTNMVKNFDAIEEFRRVRCEIMKYGLEECQSIRH